MLFKVPPDSIYDSFGDRLLRIVWFKNPNNDDNKISRILCKSYAVNLTFVIGVELKFLSDQHTLHFPHINNHHAILIYGHRAIRKLVYSPTETQIKGFFEFCQTENRRSIKK